MDVRIILSGLVSLCVFFVPAAFSDNCITYSAWRKTVYDNKNITQSVMWSLNSVTKWECLSECYQAKYCVSFHISSVLPICVAFRERFKDVSVVSVDAPGFQLFETMKTIAVEGADCELEGDCAHMTDTHCMNGLCTCDVGKEWNGTTCRKMTECTAFLNTFTTYENKSIAGHDLSRARKNNLADCEQMCIDTPGCKTADFVSTSGYCYPSTVTWFDVGDDSRIVDTFGYFYLQRDCDW